LRFGDEFMKSVWLCYR